MIERRQKASEREAVSLVFTVSKNADCHVSFGMADASQLETLLRELSDAGTSLEAAPGVVRQLRCRQLLRPPAPAAMVAA